MIKIIGLILAAVVIWAVFLLTVQHRLIYFPRNYQKGPAIDVATLHFSTGQGRQIAFYLPPKENASTLPHHLWLLLGGNASLALDWQYFAARFPDKTSGILLFDYPGYGYCEGTASPETIRESLVATLTALADYFGTSSETLRGRVSVVGHSLGAAAALDLSLHFPLANIILLSPFTSMKEMAKKAVGPPFHLLLRHQYDNVEVLRVLAGRPEKSGIVVFHGAKDEVIPVNMGRTLAADSPDMVEYHELAGVDHNSIMAVAEPDLYRLMIRMTAANGIEQIPPQDGSK